MDKQLRDNQDHDRKQAQAAFKELASFYSPSRVFRRFIRTCLLRVKVALGLHSSGSMAYDVHYGESAPRKVVAKLAERPRILHVIGNLKTGGSAQLVVDLIEGIPGDHTVAANYIPDPPRYTGVEAVEVGHVPTKGKVERLLNRLKPDLLHVHYWSTFDIDDFSMWRWYHQFISVALDKGYKVCLNINTPVEPYWDQRIARYVFVSEFVQQNFGYKDASNCVIYPGSDLKSFAPQPKEPGVETLTVGMVYRLDEHKLSEVSIQFLVDLAKTTLCRFKIVGDGPMRQKFEERAAEHGVREQFDFIGYVAYDQLNEVYAGFDVFLAPVVEESFGQVVPFAMGKRIPVLAFNTGALPEMVHPDCIIEENDVGSAVEKLEQIKRGEWTSIVEANYQNATEKFTLEQMVASYSQLYKDLIK